MKASTLKIDRSRCRYFVHRCSFICRCPFNETFDHDQTVRRVQKCGSRNDREQLPPLCRLSLKLCSLRALYTPSSHIHNTVAYSCCTYRYFLSGKPKPVYPPLAIVNYEECRPTYHGPIADKILDYALIIKHLVSMPFICMDFNPQHLRSKAPAAIHSASRVTGQT